MEANTTVGEEGVPLARRKLLAIDGGGIRGIIPATALVKLEQTTGQLTRDIFAFVAGTSTGAIIAAGIAAGVPAQRILDLYVTRSPEVLTQRPWNVPERIVTGAMYSIQKLHDLIGEEAGAARDWTLNDAPVDLLITAKRVPDGMPWYFVRDKPANSQRTGHLRLVDCVTASAAAPTYFQPWTIVEDPAVLRAHGWDPVGTLVDGGVGVAGNPVYQAVVEAFYYTGEYRPDETLVVSLGTGRLAPTERPTWLWPWLNWIVGELLASPGEQQTEIVQRHFPELPFYRLDPDLKALDPTLTQPIGLDDVGSVPRLQAYGKQFADLIDWNAILAGTDTTFRVTPQTTLAPQYERPQS